MEKRCDVRHGGACEPFIAAKVLSTGQILLIDTWRKCLTYTRSEDKYTALSYVWGGVESLKTLRSNLQDFLQDNAFSVVWETSKIPETILNAISLVALL